jgi:hypothetical protein
MIETRTVTCEEAHETCDSGYYCCPMCYTTISILVDEVDVLKAIEKRLEDEDKAYFDWLSKELSKDSTSFEDLLNKPVKMMDECKTKYCGTHDLELAQMEAAMVSNLRFA